MKKFKKAQIIAKNAPAGSYAAGCPTKNRLANCTVSCEIGH